MSMFIFIFMVLVLRSSFFDKADGLGQTDHGPTSHLQVPRQTAFTINHTLCFKTILDQNGVAFHRNGNLCHVYFTSRALRIVDLPITIAPSANSTMPRLHSVMNLDSFQSLVVRNV